MVYNRIAVDLESSPGEVSGVAACVNSSENSCRVPMESTFIDEVALLVKEIILVMLDITQKNGIGPVGESNPGPLAPLSENHATRPTGQS